MIIDTKMHAKRKL